MQRESARLQSLTEAGSSADTTLALPLSVVSGAGELLPSDVSNEHQFLPSASSSTASSPPSAYQFDFSVSGGSTPITSQHSTAPSSPSQIQAPTSSFTTHLQVLEEAFNYMAPNLYQDNEFGIPFSDYSAPFDMPAGHQTLGYDALEAPISLSDKPSHPGNSLLRKRDRTEEFSSAPNPKRRVCSSCRKLKAVQEHCHHLLFFSS